MSTNHLKSKKRKVPITIRLDQDVVSWFRSMGNGYQTQINDILRGYVKSHNQKRQFGRAKGMIQMSDDFDSPLDDFREYIG